jgi:hypothetical protein
LWGLSDKLHFREGTTNLRVQQNFVDRHQSNVDRGVAKFRQLVAEAPYV